MRVLNSGNQWRVIEDGLGWDIDTFTANDLEYGVTYQFQIESFNDAGNAEGCDIY